MPSYLDTSPAPGAPPTGATMPGAEPMVPPTGIAPGMDASAREGPNPADAPPEIQEAVITLGAKAKKKIYENPANFQNMMNMLERAGTKGFPQAASTIVNTVLDQVEKEEGPQSEDVLAAAGAIVLGAISEDLTIGGAMEVTPDMFNEAAAKAMQDWMANHPERVDQQGIVQRMAGQMQGGRSDQIPGGMSPLGQQSPPIDANTPSQPLSSYLGGM